MAWALFPALAAGFFLLGMIAVVATELMEIVALSPARLGLLTSAFLGGGGVAVFLAQAVASRVGGRVTALGTVLAVAGSVVFALSSSFGGFLAARGLQGLGAGCLLYAGLVFSYARVVPRLRQRITLIWASGAGSGYLAAMLVLPAVQSTAGYRAVSLVTAGVTLVLGGVALLHPALRALPTGDKGTAEEEDGRRTAGAPAGRGLGGGPAVLVGVGTVFVLGSLLAWSAPFLQDWYAFTLVRACYLSASLGAALVAGVWLGGVFARRARSVGVWGPLGLATILISAVPGPEQPLAELALVFGSGLFATAAMTALHLRALNAGHAEERSWRWSNSLALALVPIVAASGPWVFGLVAAAWGTGQREAGYPAAFLTLTALALVATVASMAESILAHRAPGSSEDG